MTERWPLLLPQFPRDKSFRSSRENGVWEFVPDVGRPLRGRKTSDAMEVFSGVYPMSANQREVFWTWWDSVLDRGVEPFEMFHPVTRQVVTVELATGQPPAERQVFDDMFDFDLSFRVLP